MDITTDKYNSPVVTVKEIDATQDARSQSSQVAGIVGHFNWGVVDTITSVESEAKLVQKFGTPDDDNYAMWLSASNFLKYSSSLRVVRVINSLDNATGYDVKSTDPAITKQFAFNAFGCNPKNGTGTAKANLEFLDSTNVRKIGFEVTDNEYIGSIGNDIKIKFTVGTATVATTTASFDASTNIIDVIVKTVETGTSIVNDATLSDIKTVIVGLKTATPDIEIAVTLSDDDSSYKPTNDQLNQFDGTTGFVTFSEGGFALGDYVLVKNDTDFENKKDGLSLRDTFAIGSYPGDKVNGVTISCCTSASAFNDNNTVQINTIDQVTRDVVTFVGYGTGTGQSYDSLCYETQNLRFTAVYKETAKLIRIDTTDPQSPVETVISTEYENTKKTATTTVKVEKVETTGVKLATLLPLYFLNTSSYDTTVTVESQTSKIVRRISTVNTSNTVVICGWEYKNLFITAPGTSSYAQAKGAVNDEIDIVVVDTLGTITGVRNSVIEKYKNLSRLPNATSDDGSLNYYKTFINNSSSVIRVVNGKIDASNNFIDETLTATTQIKPVFNEVLTCGQNGEYEFTTKTSDLLRGYAEFAPSTTGIDLIILADADPVVANYVISDICENRQDCMAFVSPRADLLNKTNNDDRVKECLDSLNAIGIQSTYAVMDNNWKMVLDSYNSKYRWIPCNSDIAGIVARTEADNGAWWSPAGVKRGVLKNTLKLAWLCTTAASALNASDYDKMYPYGINAIVQNANVGAFLFGDHTLTSAKTSFSRINVRRLFNIVKKTAREAMQNVLFEFNDAFTRQSVILTLRPYLLSIKADRGLEDFLLVCDETNNPPEVIMANQLNVIIAIKPAYSINFVEITMVATKSGVSFTEALTGIGLI